MSKIKGKVGKTSLLSPFIPSDNDTGWWRKDNSADGSPGTQKLQVCALYLRSKTFRHVRSFVKSNHKFHWTAKDAKCLHADIKDSDQTARILRLIHHENILI